MDVSGLGGNAGIAASRVRDTSQAAQKIEAQQIRESNGASGIDAELNKVRDAADQQRVAEVTSGTESQENRSASRGTQDGVAREFSRNLVQKLEAQTTGEQKQIEKSTEEVQRQEVEQKSQQAADGGRDTRIEP